MAATMRKSRGGAARLRLRSVPAMRDEAKPFMVLRRWERLVNVHISDYREEEPELQHCRPAGGDPVVGPAAAIAGSG